MITCLYIHYVTLHVLLILSLNYLFLFYLVNELAPKWYIHINRDIAVGSIKTVRNISILKKTILNESVDPILIVTSLQLVFSHRL